MLLMHYHGKFGLYFAVIIVDIAGIGAGAGDGIGGNIMVVVLIIHVTITPNYL